MKDGATQCEVCLSYFCADELEVFGLTNDEGKSLLLFVCPDCWDHLSWDYLDGASEDD